MDSDASNMPGPSSLSSTDRMRVHRRLHYEYYVHHIIIPLAHLIMPTAPSGFVDFEKITLEPLRFLLSALKKIFSLFAVTVEDYNNSGDTLNIDSDAIAVDADELLSSLGDAVMQHSRYHIHVAARLPDNGRQKASDVKDMLQNGLLRLLIDAGHSKGSKLYNAYEAVAAMCVVIPHNNMKTLVSYISKKNSFITVYPTEKREWFQALDKSVNVDADRKVIHERIHKWLQQTSNMRGVPAEVIVSDKTSILPSFVKDYVMKFPVSAWANIRSLASMIPDPPARKLRTVWDNIKQDRIFHEPRNLINILYTNQIDVDRLRKAIKEMFFGRNEGTKTPCLVGVPGSGKSTILNAFAKVFRSSSWENHQFGLQDAADADVIIIDEFDGSRVSPSEKGQLLKVFTGGSVQVNRKYKSPVMINFSEKSIMVGGNMVPQLRGDNVNAIRRRLEIFRFLRPIKWICSDDPFDMVNYLFDGDYQESEDVEIETAEEPIIDVERVEATIAALSCDRRFDDVGVESPKLVLRIRKWIHMMIS